MGFWSSENRAPRVPGVWLVMNMRVNVYFSNISKFLTDTVADGLVQGEARLEK